MFNRGGTIYSGCGKLSILNIVFLDEMMGIKVNSL